jgi:ABC-type branched-subunit amino acid transport system ATPase component/ABC-type branched-subunit amino acid transport system permease subunit
VLSLLPLITPLPLERITQVAIFALYTAGVMLLVGYLGLVPFGGSVFFGLAGYAAAISMLRWFAGSSEFVGIVFSVFFAVAVSAPVGALILRRRGLYFSLLTVACAQICFEIAIGWTDFTGGENGLQNVPRPVLDTPVKFHIFVVLVVIAAFWFIWRLAHSPLGRLFQAVRDNEQRVSSLGYSSYRVKLAAFMVFAAITGLAGALATFFIRGTYADYLSWERAADPLFMTVLGGVFHPMGALWGSIIFVILPDQLSAFVQNWWLVFAPFLILMALWAPEGVHGLLRRTFGVTGWTLVRSDIPERPTVITRFSAGTSDQTRADGRTPILEVRGLTKRFGSLVVASGFDFDVHAGILHSFIGPNGAGKTTFFNMLSGITLPNAGSISFFGKDITRQPMHVRCRAGLARSFQIVSVFKNLTTFENVRLAVQANRPGAYAFWADAYSNSEVNNRVWTVLDAIGLADKAGELCTRLSHGERRLLEIGITLATEARLLLLDEPLAGLGEADRDRVFALIVQLAKTHAVVLIEHDIDRVIALSDRITVLHQGRLIADGKPSIVAADPEVIRAYLGAPPEAVGATTKERIGRQGEVVLKASALVGGYGGGRVLEGVSLTVHSGEAIGLLGRNGAGKTTLLRALFGLLPLESGEILWLGHDIRRLRPFEINRLGLAMVPEGRRLFPNLTTLENLRIAMRRGGISLDDVFELFPRLSTVRHSRAESLSGGERQMVAIARALVAPTCLILLDEPFEGLAPSVVNEVMSALLKLKGRIAMVLVEHHAEQVLSVVDRAIVLVNGAVAWEGDSSTLAADGALQARLLGLVEHASSAAANVEREVIELGRR